MALRCSPVFIVCKKWAAGSNVEVDGHTHTHIQMLLSQKPGLLGRKVKIVL
jgi:hypothetical protein